MSALFPIPRSVRRLDLVASASQTVFTVDFPVLDAGDVSVARQASGNTYFTALTNGVDFTVSGVSATGATVTLIVPAGAGDVYRISGARVAARTSSLPPSGSKMRPALEGELDAINLTLQELRRECDRIEAFVNGGVQNAASQPEAEAGVLNSVFMTPLRFVNALLNGTFFSHVGGSLRSFLAKLREVEVSVTDFGAVSGGNTTTNANAFNAAITYVNGRGGGVVRVPWGTYDIDPAIGINLLSTVKLKGDGRDGTKVRVGAAMTTRELIQFSGKTGCSIEGIQISGRNFRAGSGTGSGSGGVNTITVTGVTGTILVGMLVTGTGIGPNAKVRSYNSGTGQVVLENAVHADVNNTGTVSGTINFDPVIGLIGGNTTTDFSLLDCTLTGFIIFAAAFVTVPRANIRRNLFTRTGTASYQNQALLMSPALGANTDCYVCENVSINSGFELDIQTGFVLFNRVNGFGYGGGISLDASATCFDVVNACNIITGGTGTDVNLDNCSGVESWAPTSVHALNILRGNSGCGLSLWGKHSVQVGNIAYDNGVTAHDSGIAWGYLNSTNNASYNVAVGNVSFNSLGASGPQNYALDDSNASLYGGVIGANAFNDQRVRPVRSLGQLTSERRPEVRATPSTVTPGLIAAAGRYTLTLTCAGAVPGWAITPTISVDYQGCHVRGYCHTANAITVLIVNDTGAGVTFGSLTVEATARAKADYPNY